LTSLVTMMTRVRMGGNMLTRVCVLGALVLMACSPKPPAMGDGGDMMDAGDPASPPDADTSDAPVIGTDAGGNKDSGHHCNGHHHDDDDDDDDDEHHHH